MCVCVLGPYNGYIRDSSEVHIESNSLKVTLLAELPKFLSTMKQLKHVLKFL